MSRPPARSLVIEAPVSYQDGLRLQEGLLEARIAGEIPDTVVCLEHLPVITLGRRGRQEHLLASPETLREQGIELVTASRGGDVTYHAPGQLVLYPIIRLQGRDGTRSYLAQLEQTAIDTAAAFGVEAFRRGPGKEGAWTAQGKLAAIGLRFRKWVSYHGMSFNVDVDTRGFACIVPCGLHGEAVCSLADLVDGELEKKAVRTVMLEALARNLDMDFSSTEYLDDIAQWRGA